MKRLRSRDARAGSSALFAIAFLAAQIFAVGTAATRPLDAQTSGGANAAQTSAQKPPTLKVTTRLVQVNVVVQDKKGQPVNGLTKDDFTLLDQGKQQTIATFSPEGAGVHPAETEPLPPNVFTNRFDQTGKAPGSVTILLLDALNTCVTDQAYAR